jgi:quinohemoprotein ethanol dehydrogenase
VLKLDPPPVTTDTASIKRGEALYERHCNSCHGSAAASGGLVPDLRYSAQLKLDSWYDIVLKGALQNLGMVNFGDVLNHQDATDIRNYVIMRANETLKIQKAEAKGSEAK